MATHLAAVATGKDLPFEVQRRPTPKPGPDEILVAVRSVALNPADTLMRQGRFDFDYPTVLGFDLSGLVVEVGKNVPSNPSTGGSDPFFQPGITRVAAYPGFFWKSCNPDYGAFQEKCLIPWQHAAPLPAEGMSWNEAATLPVSVQTPLSAWDAMDIPRLNDFGRTFQSSGEGIPMGLNQKQKREVLLVWGASSSVGSMGVQSARLLRDLPSSPFAAVYATASAANFEYITSLGADRMFDYKDPHAVETIISAAREDGFIIRHCFLAVGDLALCQAVLRAFVENSQDMNHNPARIVSAPPLPSNTEVVKGVQASFVQPSFDETERLAQFRYWFGTWLKENLANGAIEPSPKATVVGEGLDAINVGLDRLIQGVSCTKLVVEVTR